MSGRKEAEIAKAKIDIYEGVYKRRVQELREAGKNRAEAEDLAMAEIRREIWSAP